MTNLFAHASAFNQPINDWNVGSVQKMQGLFLAPQHSTTAMTNILRGASAFNQPIGNWNVSSVRRMQGMFRSASGFDQPLSDWDVARVTSATSMFALAIASFDQPLGQWSVSNIQKMPDMFNGASNFNQCLGSWASLLPSTAGMANKFRHTGCESGTPTPNKLNVGSWCRTSGCARVETTFKQS
eukprot:CAMPEP_0172383904 /NCGR_PEP_ID=MMETSP1061-20121228/1711_1 /TAXON_ID=37318 /ORGANISM="Pseudo-nitzschia pungens, Strain cf. pungens" /LENGTH=183 /DNA_ID=CAMNT_0013112307 /DNA_START=91 /DNA_END=643 /DNA_ORIENTATION=-